MVSPLDPNLTDANCHITVSQHTQNHQRQWLHIILNMNHVLTGQDASDQHVLLTHHPSNIHISSKHTRAYPDYSWVYYPPPQTTGFQRCFGHRYSFYKLFKHNSSSLEKHTAVPLAPYKLKETYCSKSSSLITSLRQSDLLSYYLDLVSDLSWYLVLHS